MVDKNLRRISIDKEDFIDLLVGNINLNSETVAEMIVRLLKSNDKEIEIYTHRQIPAKFY